MKLFKKSLIATAVVSSLVLPTAVFATNGMVAEGNGAKARGVGGAGVAVANENASIVTNPAAVVGVGGRLDAALGLFSPSPRQYEHTGGNPAFNAKQKSSNDFFPIPFFGMAFPVGNRAAWSFSLSAAGGMNTEYKNNFAKGGATTKTGINLAQIFLTGSYGHKIGTSTSIGISTILAYQTFEATGLEAFTTASSAPGALSNTGVDSSTGFGIKLGLQGKLSSDVRYGVSYQPKIMMSKFEKYKGLFANQGQLDIPATFAAGVAVTMNPTTTVLFDYSYIDYENVDAVGNKVSVFPGKQFGATDGPGFGWKSISVYKIGVEYQVDSNWIYRGGWNHGENPVQDDEISVAFLAPGVTTDHLTVGFTNKLSSNSEWSMNFVHSLKNSSSGNFSSSFGGGTMTVEMEQNFLEAAYSKMF